MSCSKWLLNKKGPLATVWVAAFRRVEALTRDQVATTDIVAFVDKILQDAQAPQRILALLLLGLVKIYCKKVQYVYDDCNTIFRSLERRRCAEPSTSTGTSMQVKKAVHAGRQKYTNKVKKSIHAVRITEISGSMSSEGLPVRTETEINVQASVVVRETRVSADVPAFTIPTRFELDSFDLGIAEDIDDGEDRHQSGHQDISLEGERHHAPSLYESNQRALCSYAVDSACLMPEHIALPPEVIGALNEVNNILEWSIKGHEPERENENADSVWFTPVKDVLPPETMEIVVEGKDPSYKSKMGDKSTREVNMDEDVGSTCSTLLAESQERQISENVLKNMSSASPSASYPTMEELEHGLLLEKSNTGPQVGGFHEHETEGNESRAKSNTGLPVEGHVGHEAEEHDSMERPVLSCRTQALNDLSPSTPEPLPDGIPGRPSSSSFMVRTPAKIEKRQQGTKKRKKNYYNKEDYLQTEREEKLQRRRLIFPKLDEVIILSNCMMEKAIRDTSDITQRRKKAPHTCLNTWKVAKIGSLPDNFMDPLIPYQTSVHLASITTPEAPERSCGEVKARRRLSYKLSESSRSSEDAGATERENFFDESRKRKLGGPTGIEASVSENGHLQDDVRGCNDDTAKEKGTQIEGDQPISVILSDKGLHESENHSSLHIEASYAVQDNINELQDAPMDEEHTRDEGLLSSIRTRKIARFLHQRFLDQNSNQGTNSLSLNYALEGKERRTSAIFFYETLVLKSRGLIEVSQEQPYEDIMLLPTPQLEAELQRPSAGISR